MIYGTREKENAYQLAIQTAFYDMFGADLFLLAFEGEWITNERSRAPYVDSWKLRDAGITLYASETLSHCCIEITGTGCERLISLGLLDVVLAHCCERVTRIDIACDIECHTRPQEFVAQLSNQRMKSSGFQKSESGETCYVGSQKSERYARVYRYQPPHPRSHLLRIEHVFRRDHAKEVAKVACRTNLVNVAVAAGNLFGWSHPIWRPAASDMVQINPAYVERKMGKTIYWLVKQVAPAFRKLVEDGTIRDPEGFLRDYFLEHDKHA